MGCDTGTTYLEAKLLQPLTTMREEVLYAIFLDMQKAYDALDWNRCLNILEGYALGPQACLILHQYWDRLMMVARVGG